MLTAVGGGRFEVRGLAGEGGAGLVYRGIDRADGGTVAVKILRDGVSVGERFARESHLLAESCRPAGDGRRRPDAAIGFADRAIACGADGEVLAEAELVRAAAFDWKGDVEPGGHAARRAVEGLPPGSRRWCRAVVLRARLLLHHAHIDGVRALARELLELANGGAITVELASTGAIIAYLLRMSGAHGDQDDALLAVIESRSPPEVLGDPMVRGHLILNRVARLPRSRGVVHAARHPGAGAHRPRDDRRCAARPRHGQPGPRGVHRDHRSPTPARR